MATNTGAGEARGEASDIKRKLVRRMGFAGLMIVTLLGGLALFDHYSAPADPEPATQQFTEPVPVPKKAATQPLTPAEPAEPATSAAATPEASAAPIDRAAAPLGPPPRPQVAAQPALPREAAKSPALAGKASDPRAAEMKAAGSAPAGGETAAAAASQPTPPRLSSGYLLQAGVFADPRRAEELHARLVHEGMPATIEARVHVGPFKNKAEADAVRARLKLLGIDSVRLPPRNSRR